MKGTLIQLYLFTCAKDRKVILYAKESTYEHTSM